MIKYSNLTTSDSSNTGYVYTPTTTTAPQMITWAIAPFTPPKLARWIELEEANKKLKNLTPKKEILPISFSEENIDYFLNGK